MNDSPSVVRQRRILVIHQNFPGQFRHVLATLQGRADVEVIGIGREGAPGMPGVQWLRYKTHRAAAKETHPYCRSFENAVLHGQAVCRLLMQLKDQGFVPDVVLAHPGWGETLYLREVFPQAKLIHLCEWFYDANGPDMGFDPEFPVALDDRLRVSTWRAHHLLALDQCDVAIAPTQWQKSQFPAIYQPKIQVLHEGIATDVLGPDPQAELTLPNGQVLKAGDPVVTYVARNLEPYRGFHVFMRCLPALLAAHPTCQVLIVGGDEVSYGRVPKNAKSWREALLREVNIDTSSETGRVNFLGKLPYAQYRRVLQVSAVHVYLTYPFVLSWSLLEALASGCAVVASDTAPVREVIRHGENGWLVSFFDGARLVDAVGKVLSDQTGMRAMRLAAVESVKEWFAQAAGTAGYLDALGLQTGSAATVKTVSETSAEAT
ncbi:MAG: glycosyltransferase family 4 protein [Hydrogenophaga sp.]|jgi:glycosyltransferase involved in cell wall biosynthesis|nr:glycosyltransferase family 4 protein [Hydrogenophaga sp.]